MHLVQILLPLADNENKVFPEETLRKIQSELTEQFGGVTAYNRAPAQGVWKSGEGKQKDDIVIVEVMTDDIDRQWWQEFRRRTEKILKQEKLIIRTHPIELL